MKIIRVLLLLSVLSGLLACRSNPSPPSAGETQPTPAAAVEPASVDGTSPELVTQPVTPGETEQVAAYEDRLRVILPGGSVRQAGRLTISPVSGQLPEVLLGMERLATFDISLGEQQTFDRPITLEFGIDPAQLNDNLPPALQAQAAYWDEQGRQWVAVPATVDAARRVAVVETTHLSVWSLVLWARGYETDPTAHFLFIYDKSDVLKRTGSYTGQTGYTMPGIPPYVADLMDCLEKEYAAYEKEGYPLPATPIPVHVGAYAQPDLQTILGRIRLPYDLTRIEDMRQTTAHELFHAVQLETLTTAVYGTLQWWLDATADYAADAVAWKSIQGTGLMGQDIKQDWLEHDIYTIDNAHAYALSHFVDYLVRDVGIDFKNLWYASISSYPRILANVEAFVQAQSGTSLGFHFTNYLAEFLFNAVGPCQHCSEPFNPYNDLSTHSTAWTVERGPELRDSFNAPYYGANVWAIQNQNKDRNIVVDRLDGGSGTVSVYILPEGDALGQLPVGPVFVSAGAPANLFLKSSDYLFVVMDNTVDPNALPFSMRVSESALPAVDTYRLMFQFGEGACEQQAASGWGWILVRNDRGAFIPFYEQPSGEFVSAEHAITVDGSARVETVVGKDGVSRTYMTLTLQGDDKMYAGAMSLSGTVKLLQNPDMPTEWSTGDGTDPNGGSIDVYVDVSIPARPLDDYPGMACTAEATSATMYPK